ncbi:YozE family protein [Aquibacillus sp. 3ASR75-11]|uniref:UPF0346 protein NC797_09440 n=1 Tax=Terrihalobacillus insolitus TaxID=2950438 RepID=A0A9X4ALT8_9BACI|nr:YozE family protein [Terrihalobacillus insolitus]MDC3412979.1 YozE family protein [Terrihalobacillus insolitus]MDC3424732.1 YozE family protein [Terrihalobacillus insolitus]
MRSFYHYMMRFRGSKLHEEESQLAEWMFHDSNFPKQSTNYDEISSYLEWNIPFTNALRVFDHIWDEYLANELK